MSQIFTRLAPLLILLTLQGHAKERPALRVGVPMSSFGIDSASDARIATSVSLKKSFDLGQVAYDGKVFENDQGFVAAFKVDKIDFFVMNSGLYLDSAEDLSIHPVLVSIYDNHPVENLVPVSKKGLELSDLNGASLLVDHSARGKTPLRWISDHLLRSGAGKTARGYFSRIEEVNTASRAILPVYFKDEYLLYNREIHNRTESARSVERGKE
jgi:hypothetical protein